MAHTLNYLKNGLTAPVSVPKKPAAVPQAVAPQEERHGVWTLEEIFAGQRIAFMKDMHDTERTVMDFSTFKEWMLIERAETGRFPIWTNETLNNEDSNDCLMKIWHLLRENTEKFGFLTK